MAKHGRSPGKEAAAAANLAAVVLLMLAAPAAQAERPAGAERPPAVAAAPPQPAQAPPAPLPPAQAPPAPLPTGRSPADAPPAPLPAAGTGDTFRVHPENPRCFLYRGKPFKILTSAEHYGAVINADFDYDAYLEEMARTGQNMTRVFTFYRETPSCIPAPGAQNTLAPRPEASILPWPRVAGHGRAADGLDKFDLDRWNPAYFARWKDFLAKCAARGVVVEVSLFCNPYNKKKMDLMPCGKPSNTGGVGGGLGDPREFMTLKDPAVVALQERFIRKMAEELNAFDNFYWEICNEPNVHGDYSEETEAKVVAWQARLARAVRRAEQELPKRHLVAVNAHFRVKLQAGPGQPDIRHDDAAYFANPDVDIINYHYISVKKNARGLAFSPSANEEAGAGVIWPFLRERDKCGKPIVFDETFTGIVRGQPERYAVNRAEAWEMLLAGGAGYDSLDWSFTPADETGCGKAPIGDGRRLDGRPLREWLGHFHKLLAQYDLAAMVPAVGVLPDRIPGCGCAVSAAGPGRYLAYFVDERLYRLQPCPPRALAVTLNLPAGRYAVRRFDPKTGAAADLPALAGGPAAALAVPEFAEDVAILLERTPP